MSVFADFEHIVRENESLAPYTWFRLGGTAQYFAEPTTQQELLEIIKRCSDNGIPVRLLGGGSRILVPDGGVEGLVVHLTAPEFSEIKVQGQRVIAGGGGKLGLLVSSAVREGLAGLEALVGIPGTVGGTLRGNADSHGSSIGQWTETVRVLDRNQAVIDLERSELRFSYGESSLYDSVILRATFLLESGDAAELTRRMQKLWIVKRSSQPSGDLGTGRIFKDPQGQSAAELIETAGLRGLAVGKAKVADASSNFIEVESGASSSDVRQLIEKLQDEVASQLEVRLEREIEFW